MDNESQVIHLQMEETRTALQEKLETLEQQVKNTVEGATEAVAETVENVKDAVQDTVETVKGTVQDTVASVKDAFNVPRQVRAHPWPMFLGATAVGFLATRWLTAHRAPTPEPALAAATSRNGSPAPGNGYAASPVYAAPAPTPAPAPAPEPSWWSWIADHYGEELAKVKGLAFGTMGGLVREVLMESAAPALAEQIKDVVDGVTAKLGGHVIEGPLLPPSKPEGTTVQGTEDDQRYPTKMARPLGAA